MHISDYLKAYLSLLITKYEFMNSSQYNEAYSLDFMDFPVTVNRYEGISQFGHYKTEQ